MNVELSFLVDGDMYKAVMQKEKSCTELEKSELVTIRLFEQDRSILLRSFTEENGKVDLRLILLLSFCFVPACTIIIVKNLVLK